MEIVDLIRQKMLAEQANLSSFAIDRINNSLQVDSFSVRRKISMFILSSISVNSFVNAHRYASIP